MRTLHINKTFDINKKGVMDSKQVNNKCINIVTAGQDIQTFLETSKDKIPSCVDKIELPEDELALTEENVNQQFYHWLKYIVSNYHFLNDYTMFLSASPMKHTRFLNLEDLFKVMNHEPSYFMDITAWAHIIKCDGEGKPHHSGLPVQAQYERFFPEVRVPRIFEFVYGGNEMMSKRRIQSRTLEFYKALLTAMEKKELDLNTIERLWHQI